MLAIFKHKRASVDTKVLQAAHAENVGLLTQILTAQNQFGAMVTSQLEEMKRTNATALGQIDRRLSAVETSLKTPPTPPAP